MNHEQLRSLNFSLLGKNSNLEGDLKFSGDTILNCAISGTLTMLEDSFLTLERESKVRGGMTCHEW